MEIKKITIGNFQTENNVFLAPMAGYTNYSFRHTIIPFGVGFCFTELVSAKGLFFDNKNNSELIYSQGDFEKTGVQIFGNDPYYLRSACECEYLKDFKVVDINMGCPVPKVYKNGEGSAMLKDIALAERCVKECVKSGKNITVKIRTGLKYGDDVAEEYAKMAEYSGAKLITVHGRVREAYYSGEVDYNAIYKAKKAVNIPVIANGGIFTVEDADKMTENTGADGVMIARGAIANPFIFDEIIGRDDSHNLKAFAINFLELFKERYGDRRASLEFRKYCSYFYKNVRNGKQIRLRICQTDNINEIKEIISQTL